MSDPSNIVIEHTQGSWQAEQGVSIFETTIRYIAGILVSVMFLADHKKTEPEVTPFSVFDIVGLRAVRGNQCPPAGPGAQAGG